MLKDRENKYAGDGGIEPQGEVRLGEEEKSGRAEELRDVKECVLIPRV